MADNQTTHSACKKCAYNKIPRPGCLQEWGRYNQHRCPAMQDPLTAQFADMLKDVPTPTLEEAFDNRFRPPSEDDPEINQMISEGGPVQCQKK